MKRIILNVCCIVCLVCIAGVVLWGISQKKENKGRDVVSFDTDEKIDDSFHLEDTKTTVDFTKVVLAPHQEMRKLIVSEQEGTVTTKLTQKMIEKMDYDFLKKSQDVTYTGKGVFVVNLDELTEDSIVDARENKVLTIKIGHAHLEAIEIDPNKITIGGLKEGFIARGELKLTIQDYNSIEKEIRGKLEEVFDTAENGQKADQIALKMVKETYEPIIKAIDSEYMVNVVFLDNE